MEKVKQNKNKQKQGKQNKTKQNKKNKKRQTMIHKTENDRKLTCPRIDITEHFWVGVKRQSLTHSLHYKNRYYDFIGPQLYPKGVEDMDLQTSLYNTIVLLRDIVHICLVIGSRPAVLAWGAAERQYSRPRTYN